jgi:3',5'-cyclic AMP phosphodiesterase CpdA
MKHKLWIPLVILFFVIAACERVFEYTPYSANVKDSRKYTHAKNMEMLSSADDSLYDQNSYKVALISDSHTAFDDLAEVVELIKQDEEISFVVHGGDMTDGGMIEEYTIFYQIMEKLKLPYFTVIGNHDCLANGRTIYNDQYGAENYSFVYRNCKFVFFNDIIWELNYEEPDFMWLIQELDDASSYKHVFVIAHIPPWSDQFSTLSTNAYRIIMDSHNVSMSIHGHHHDHYFGNYFQDSIPYLVIGSPDKGSYCTLTIRSDTVLLETIKF